MIAQSKKAARLISLIALTLTTLLCVTLVRITHAERQSELHTEKVSALLKTKNRADETVTVIVTLAGSRSERLNAFIRQTGVRQRKEMKNLHSFSLSLPFRMVAELASFPEVSYVTSNEVVRSLGHVSQTTGAEAGQAAAVAAGRGSINGAGVGLAVLDSGIDVNHAQFSQTEAVLESSQALILLERTGRTIRLVMARLWQRPRPVAPVRALRIQELHPASH